MQLNIMQQDSCNNEFCIFDVKTLLIWLLHNSTLSEIMKFLSFITGSFTSQTLRNKHFFGFIIIQRWIQVRCINVSVIIGGCGCALLNKHILDIIKLAPLEFFSAMNLNIERLGTLEKFAKMLSLFSLLFFLIVLGAHLRVAF